MSARNMIRNLRDSGSLDERPPRSRLRSGVALVLGALCFGFVAYFAATTGVPALIQVLEKKPAPMSFVKP
jgi:hypothetical protein